MTRQAVQTPQNEPLVPGDKCTIDQIKALFAAAHARGLSDDDLRAMTPTGSVKALKFMEASALLNRLNGRKDGYVPNRARKKAARRPTDVFAPLSDEQRDLIDRKLRIALGWTPQQMKAHLETKHYVSDPTRDMSSILSSTDGVAVAEHLKKVLLRTLEQHAARLEKSLPHAITTQQLMKSLPPYDRLHALMVIRLEELDQRLGKPAAAAWLADQRLPDGRLLQHVAFCADAAELIYRIESKLRDVGISGRERERPGRMAKTPQPGHTVADPTSADDAPELNYSFTDYQQRRVAR
jgi:hypothetical protein